MLVVEGDLVYAPGASHGPEPLWPSEVVMGEGGGRGVTTSAGRDAWHECKRGWHGGRKVCTGRFVVSGWNFNDRTGGRSALGQAKQVHVFG